MFAAEFPVPRPISPSGHKSNGKQPAGTDAEITPCPRRHATRPRVPPALQTGNPGPEDDGFEPRRAGRSLIHDAMMAPGVAVWSEFFGHFGDGTTSIMVPSVVDYRYRGDVMTPSPSPLQYTESLPNSLDINFDTGFFCHGRDVPKRVPESA